MEDKQNKILYLDGIRLRRAVVAGANWLIQMQKHLDNINVFPVADHDTGTNMAYTMHSITENISTYNEISASRTSKFIADSALLDAQGNSGAILAQFFEGLESPYRVDPEKLMRVLELIPPPE